MYKVYWTEGHLTDRNSLQLEFVEHGQLFPSEQLGEALAFTESLRARRRAGEPISFVCIQSEDPNAVGEQGVSDKLPVGYDWTKRRSEHRHRGTLSKESDPSSW